MGARTQPCTSILSDISYAYSGHLWAAVPVSGGHPLHHLPLPHPALCLLCGGASGGGKPAPGRRGLPAADRAAVGGGRQGPAGLGGGGAFGASKPTASVLSEPGRLEAGGSTRRCQHGGRRLFAPRPEAAGPLGCRPPRRELRGAGIHPPVSSPPKPTRGAGVVLAHLFLVSTTRPV
eukprot:SAG22_NODE_408_length_10942_cov_6.157429_4_plen_177_part_00